jgi:hypothetical protein
VKQDLDAVRRIIARLGGKRRAANNKPPAAKKSLDKPRTLADDKVKTAIVAWAEKYFRRTGNKTSGFRQLADLMLADGVAIPGDNPVFVVSGIITRNKKFKGKDGQWHLKEFAA